MPNPGLERLAIICSHPVQYYAPLFKMMAQHHDVKVFYKEQQDKLRYDPGFQCTVAWDLPLLDGYKYAFTQRLKEIKRYQPTSILIYGWAHSSHLKIIWYFSRCATLLFRGDSTLLDHMPRWRRMLKSFVLSRIYKKFHYALYVGHNNKLYFQEYGFKTSQLIYAPHAIDNSRFSDNNQLEITQIRASFDIGDQDILILYSGKLIPKKNPEILLSAFSQIEREDVHLLFVGSGKLEQKLKSTAAAFQAAKGLSNIHFLPFQNQQRMPAIYQSCELFCMPSIGPAETWGLAINEAMAAGKPILASSMVGAAVDLIDHSNGQIFQAGNQKDLVAKLRDMLVDKDELKEMGRASGEKIKNWSYQHQIQAIYGIK